MRKGQPGINEKETEMRPLEIKKCLEKDIADAGVFYDKIVKQLDEHVNYPRWIYKVYPSDGSVRTKTQEGTQYLCFEDEKIVGAFVLDDKPQGNYGNGQWAKELPEGAYMILHALAIDPGIQRRGAGSAVVRFCIDTAKARGYQGIRLDVVPDNFPARTLFERNGFTCAGDADLQLDIGDIPFFSLYELNF